MKLIRWGEVGREKPGLLLEDGTRLDASNVVAGYDEKFFEDSGLDTLRRWLDRHESSAPRISSSIRLGPPISRPSKIICIGVNYREHVAESGAQVPLEPVVFMKATSSLIGPNDPVVIPKNAKKLDWEVELAVVIGKKASYISKEESFEFVAGYTLHNDYSERSFQLERGGQWVKGTSADTFAPLGPFVATPDEIPDVHNVRLWLKVNGETKQSGSTKDLVFDVPTLVSYISQFMTLLPGDVISTGTPAGVGMGQKPPRFLVDGDVVELGIDGLGSARQRLRAHSGAC